MQLQSFRGLRTCALNIFSLKPRCFGQKSFRYVKYLNTIYGRGLKICVTGSYNFDFPVYMYLIFKGQCHGVFDLTFCSEDSTSGLHMNRLKQFRPTSSFSRRYSITKFEIRVVNECRDTQFFVTPPPYFQHLAIENVK